MKYVFILLLSLNIGCKGILKQLLDERDKDKGPKGPGNDVTDEIAINPATDEPWTLEEIYVDYVPYTTACPLDDHNCAAEDYIHEIDSLGLCEAVALWTLNSGEMFILEDPGEVAGPDMIVFYDDPAAPYGGTDEWAVTGRNGTGFSDSTWTAPGVAYIDERTLNFGDCKIKVNFSYPELYIESASWMDVEIYNNIDGLIYE